MFTLWSDMDRLFNLLNDRDYRYAETVSQRFQMNLQDKGDHLEFIAELPGVAEKDMNLEGHNDTLNLSAKREVEHSNDNKLYLSERGSWNIQKSVSLPTPVEVDKAKATLKDGILRVELPKSPNSRPHQIQIKA